MLTGKMKGTNLNWCTGISVFLDCNELKQVTDIQRPFAAREII